MASSEGLCPLHLTSFSSLAFHPNCLVLFEKSVPEEQRKVTDWCIDYVRPSDLFVM